MLATVPADGEGAARPSFPIRVLGAISVPGPTGPVSLTGRPARLLATLAAANGRWLTVDTLLDEVWDVCAGRGALHACVSRLRTYLGDWEHVVETGPVGYRVSLDERSSDLVAFEASWRDARHAANRRRWNDVFTCADRAIALWRGAPFGGLEDGLLARSAAVRLTDQYVECVERATHAAIETGDASRYAEQLAGVVADEPLRESTWCWLARSRQARGARGRALRAIAELRRHLAAAGLTPSRAVLDVEAEVLREAGEHGAVRSATAPPSAGARRAAGRCAKSQASIALHAGDHSTALAEAERAQRLLDGLDGVDADLAGAWNTIAAAAKVLNQPLRVRCAVVNAMRHAAAAGDAGALIDAARLSVVALTPAEPNRALMALVEHLRETASEERAVTLDAVLAAHLAMVPDPHVWRRAHHLADEAVTAARRVEDWSALLPFALQCWLLTRDGQPDIDQQLAVATERVGLTAPASIDRLNALLHRIPRRLALGDWLGARADLAALAHIADSLAATEGTGFVHQVLAALDLASCAQDSAFEHIEVAAALLANHPVHQDVAGIQRWWLIVAEAPDTVLPVVEAVAGQTCHPAHRAILAYTRFRAGDLAGAHDVLVELCPHGPPEAPRDLAWPATVAGLMEIAAGAGDTGRVQALLGILRPYEGRFIVAADSAFVMGAAARFIGIGELALGATRAAMCSLQRARRLEESVGAQTLAATTSRLQGSLADSAPDAPSAIGKRVVVTST